ncbi:four helix bundle protein [Chryseobacterium sp. HSC-36S06]|uniref:four helix bundle protein n=1 Tax=Chryseobacterium sp. HSC-36S06 TaxID=2910970 RepID=UPI001A28AB4F|nr:four helix bundle protein [Chryseobacterium sp. HSC-36S06]MBH1959030.1 four helix bundle protein [Flavobacteriia bacterium]MBH2023645.1 four helix bundle protein [Flavobacteriales bacterium]MCP2037016.1 four helix bundle protein [Chryseobacterium sp. HSC-36S06]
MNSDIRSHKDLKVWQESMDLVTEIYRLSDCFPENEKYGLISQIRRCAISIPSNIAEGCARKGNRELLQYLYISLGSLAELETQYEIAQNLNYINESEEIRNKIIFIRIMLSNLIKSIKNKPS